MTAPTLTPLPTGEPPCPPWCLGADSSGTLHGMPVSSSKPGLFGSQHRGALVAFEDEESLDPVRVGRTTWNVGQRFDPHRVYIAVGNEPGTDLSLTEARRLLAHIRQMVDLIESEGWG